MRTAQLHTGGTVQLTLPMPMPIGDPADVDPASGGAPGRTPSARTKPSRADAEREGSLLLLAEDHPVNRTVRRLAHRIAGAARTVGAGEPGRGGQADRSVE